MFPRVVNIIFGKMGSGKSVAAKMLADELGYGFYEGDNAVSKEMREKVKNFEPLEEKDIDNLVQNLILEVREKLTHHHNIVVPQALYRNKHRKVLLDEFSKDCVVNFIYITTPVDQQFKQLLTRERGEKWVDYAMLNDIHFQEPDDCLKAHIIKNPGDVNLVKEFAPFIEVVLPKSISAAEVGLFAHQKQASVHSVSSAQLGI